MRIVLWTPRYREVACAHADRPGAHFIAELADEPQSPLALGYPEAAPQTRSQLASLLGHLRLDLAAREPRRPAPYIRQAERICTL
jgi:hypothetical protein